MPVTPAAKRREVEAARDQAVHVLQHQHLRENQLTFWPDLEFPHGLICQCQQLLTGQLVLELLDALENELPVLLAERQLRP